MLHNQFACRYCEPILNECLLVEFAGEGILGDEGLVRRVFEQKGAKRLTDMLTKARKKGRPE